MKKTLLFWVLMLISSITGVVSAQSVCNFVASSEPADGEFAADTHWYYLTLRGRYITLSTVDADGNLKVTSTSATDIADDGAKWCVVGNSTDGYKFYNKKSGASKILGILNATGAANNGNLNNYGASRAQMYDASTENSIADNSVGTTFTLNNKSGEATTNYYPMLKGSSDRYWNERNGYLAYWQSGGALGDPGSKLLFYDAETYWNTLVSANITNNENIISTVTSNAIGTNPFCFSQENLDTYKDAVNEVKNATTTYDYTTANEAIAKLNAAYETFFNTYVRPKTGVIYKIKCVYNSLYLNASTNWTNGQVLPMNSAETQSTGWILEAGSSADMYKLKSADTGMYLTGTTSFTTSNTGTEYTIIPSYQYNQTGSIGNYGKTEHKWLHGNGNNVISWAYAAGASYWQFIEISEDDFASLTDKRLSNGTYTLPGVEDAEALATYKAVKTLKTEALWNAYAEKMKANIESKYYRISNARGVISVLATNGASTPKMYSKADGNKLVSSIWQLKVCEDGFKMHSVDNPNSYIAALTNAAATDNSGKTANSFTTYDNGIKLVPTKRTDGYYEIRDRNGNILNGENTGNCPINYWNAGSGSEGAKWQFTEATDLTITLNAANNNTYATTYLPFSISSVTGAKAYVAQGINNGYVHVDETTNGVKAENGFLLIGEAGSTTATLTIGESETTSQMTGTLTDLDMTNENHDLYNVFGRKTGTEAGTTVVGFFTPSSNVTSIKANRGFFKGSGAQALMLNFSGESTGIDAAAIDTQLSNAPIYDLSGRKVAKAAKGGVYIQNGRKYIIK